MRIEPPYRSANSPTLSARAAPPLRQRALHKISGGFTLVPEIHSYRSGPARLRRELFSRPATLAEGQAEGIAKVEPHFNHWLRGDFVLPLLSRVVGMVVVTKSPTKAAQLAFWLAENWAAPLFVAGIGWAFNDRLNRIEDQVQRTEGKLEGKIESLETKMDQRFESLETKTDRRFESLEKKLDQRFAALDNNIKEMVTKETLEAKLETQEVKLKLSLAEARNRGFISIFRS